MTRRGAAVLSAAAPGTSRPSVRYSLPETTRRPCRAAQTKIRAQGKSEKKRIEQKTNKGNAGGVDPGPEPFDLPAVTTQISARRLRTQDEHRGTGTTNHGGTTGNGAGAGRDPRRRRHAKGTQSSATNNGRTARKRGTGEPLKGGACVLHRRTVQKNTRHRHRQPLPVFPRPVFPQKKNRTGKEEEPEAATNRRRTGGKLDRAPRSLCVVLATLCRSRRGNDTRRHKRALQALTEQNRPPRPLRQLFSKNSERRGEPFLTARTFSIKGERKRTRSAALVIYLYLLYNRHKKRKRKRNAQEVHEPAKNRGDFCPYFAV